MARTTTISNEQILEAAREMFQRHGFSATTSQIAEAAGVSEGSIFRRWSSKTELFVAALGVERPAWFDGLDELAASDHSVDEQLTILANDILDFFLANIPKMHAIFSCGVTMKRRFMEEDALPVQGVKAFTKYFTHLRRARRIGVKDPEIVARMFVGSLHHYAFADFAGLNDVMPMPRESYVRGLVACLIEGIGDVGDDT